VTGATATTSPTPALRAHGVRISLGGVEILRGVELDLYAGTVVGVLGPSGAGKTTLFRVLVGELRPQSGTVWLGGCDVSRAPLYQRARRGLGYVPQTPSVLFDLSVRENLRAFERAARVPRRPPEERAELVQLGSRIEVRAAELSGGERRRLELLRALIAEPSVLICDEPLSGVDPAGARRLGELLRSQAARGAAVVLADHRVREALPFCDQALLLVDGKIELDAPPDQFADHLAVRRRYLG
jgi:lipopolysaccharide export system ATP-binding protein